MAVSHASGNVIYLVTMACGLAANLIALVMVSKVNEVVPPEERLAYFGRNMSYRTKFGQLYPNDALIRLHDALLGLFFLLPFAGALITFGLV
jgi:hypothetical protein